MFLREGTDWDHGRRRRPRSSGQACRAWRACRAASSASATWTRWPARPRSRSRRRASSPRSRWRRGATTPTSPPGSMEMNQIIGARALRRHAPTRALRMKNPDVTVGVEVVQNASYVYARSRAGRRRACRWAARARWCACCRAGIDSPVATWKLARRGAVCIGVHFSGRPQTSDASEYLVDDIAQRAGAHGLHRSRVHGAVRRLPARDRSAPCRPSCASSCTAVSCSRWPRRSLRRERAGSAGDGREPGPGCLADARQHPLH